MLLLSACVAASPPPVLPFRLTPVATLDGPTALVTPASGPDGLYVAEQAGRVWRLVDGSAPALVLDVRSRVRSGGELGLLGLAFAAEYPQDPRVFVNYTYEDPKLRTRVASYVMNAEGTRLDPASEVEVLSFAQPYPNHNGGALATGPDGLLYIAVGDGGGGGDPQGHGQDLSDWLGSILRIDVRPVPYTVPPDNPFVATGPARDARPEIWAYGVRNPWGMHFDRDTLWFADVGQDRWEEVNRGVKGGNYGWNVLEGAHCYGAARCDGAPFVVPVAAYGHDLGQSVTGGTVYRGPSIPALNGRYVYADFASGRFWALPIEESPIEGGAPTLLGRAEVNPSAFGTDRAGRLYVGDYRGQILRIDP